MSAELLRQAAKVLRERAEIVERAPWQVTHIDSKIIPGTRDGQDEWFVMGCFDGVQSNQCGPFAVCDWEPSATYIATMHPGVGLALADLLETLAYDREVNGEIDGRTWDHDIVPLARLILAGAS